MNLCTNDPEMDCEGCDKVMVTYSNESVGCVLKEDPRAKKLYKSEKHPPPRVKFCFDKIVKYINDEMAHYTDSRQPTDDQVRIAWLVDEVERLRSVEREYDIELKRRIRELEKEEG